MECLPWRVHSAQDASLSLGLLSLGGAVGQAHAVTESHLVAERGTALGPFTWAALDNRGRRPPGPTETHHGLRLQAAGCFASSRVGHWAGGGNQRQGGWPGHSDQEPPDGLQRRREVRRTGSA